MIGADDSSRTMTGSAVQQPRRAMPADIEERRHCVVLSAHRDQGLAQEIQRMVIAGFGYVAQVAYHLPRIGEHALLLGFQEFRVPIGPARETESFEADGNA